MTGVAVDQAVSHLLRSCFLHGPTSVTESGKTASLDRRDGECVLVFRIRSSDFPPLSIERSCDAVFFHLARDGRPTVLLVELKGSDITHAVEQIVATLPIVTRGLGALRPKVRAVIVTERGVPKQAKRQILHFRKIHNVPLKTSKDGRLRSFL